MRRLCSIILAAHVLLTAVPGRAQEFKAGDIAIDKPWSRATPKGSAVGAGYLTIHNRSATADRLVGGAADFAGNVSIHEMSKDNGIMRMRELTNGLEIPAGGDAILSPGGFHIMFAGLKRPLVRGERVKARLTFEHAGAIDVEFEVGGIGAAGPGDAPTPGDSMKGMKM
jgi:periplasmic copper chaperone A